MRPLLLPMLGVLLAAPTQRSAGQEATDQGSAASNAAPYVVVLGIAQDGGYPQTGDKESPAWDDPGKRRLVSCLALVDPSRGQRWLFDATPDIKEQLYRLDVLEPVDGRPGLAGIFLTHAHMGHYTGLLQIGHEALGGRRVPVYAMPRMAEFLSTNGPWDQLVRYENIELRPLAHREPVDLGAGLSVTPILVPHRDEYSETVGFHIAGPERRVLFIPDINKWTLWDEQGVRLEDELAKVDVAYLDGTFYADGEIPGRNMAQIPHPFIAETMERLAPLAEEERRKVRFIHLNRTNPTLLEDSEAQREIEVAGFGVAREGEQVEIGNSRSVTP